MRDLSNLLWCDLENDRERLAFIKSGLAVDTGILAQTMAEDLVEVYRRIDEAVKALQDITRCEVYADDQCGIYDERNEHGHWVQWDDVAHVVEILRGNSPVNPEGSP